MTLHEIAITFNLIVESFKLNYHYLLILFAILWGVHIINALLHYRLNVLGVYPRHPFGLIGILCSPVLHGDTNHLIFNTPPFLILANFILIGGLTLFFTVSLKIILISGALTWLFGRKAIHIGASALIMGYWSYLIITAYQHQSLMAIIVAILVLYYFGGMIFQLVPTSEKTSWEGHLFGFIAGIIVALI